MGGNALKNAFTRRFEVTEFLAVSDILLDKLRETFDRVEMPLYYKSKESFGDADILVLVDKDFNMMEYIKDTFNPIEIFHNGNCWSFDYNELQVDLITTTPEDFDSNYMYLCYNDLGNMIGRLAHGMGLKYAQEGLVYDHYYKDKNIGRVIISKDYDKILKFLDLSYDRWKEGFETLEDIFKYVSESKFFNWEMYQLKNLNKVNRERNVKRKSYQALLEWIDQNVADDNHKFEFVEDKSKYLEDVIKAFPESQIVMEMRRMEYEEARKLYINAKFNGGEVIRRYGYTGKELGDRITGFKESLGSSYDNFILKSSQELIYEVFEDYANGYNLSVK